VTVKTKSAATASLKKRDDKNAEGRIGGISSMAVKIFVWSIIRRTGAQVDSKRTDE
jgi:hypothetical protein